MGRTSGCRAAQTAAGPLLSSWGGGGSVGSERGSVYTQQQEEEETWACTVSMTTHCLGTMYDHVVASVHSDSALVGDMVPHLLVVCVLINLRKGRGREHAGQKGVVMMRAEDVYLQLSSQILCDCKYITMETTAPQHHVV